MSVFLPSIRVLFYSFQFLLSQNSSILLDLAHYGNQVLCGPDSIFDSLVITHGTGKFYACLIDLSASAHMTLFEDTLEETAFFSTSSHL